MDADSNSSSLGRGESAADRVSIMAAEEEAAEEVVPPSPSSQDTTLARQHWYLGGEVSTDAAVSVLAASDSYHCFGVYRNSDKKYIMSTKILVEGKAEPLYEHLPISTRTTGKFKVSGQAVSHEDISEAVQQFVLTFEPPLVPALQVTGFETQISIADDPPDYERANKVLKPDIAPLPDIAYITVEQPEEAKIGQLSPDTNAAVFNIDRFNSFNPSSRHNRGNPPHGTSLSRWRRYPGRHRCHPKNVCSGCCYRKRTWNGSRYSASHKWYDCRGNGPLRLFGLLIFFLLCGPCFACGLGCYYCITLILYLCCADYDS